MKTLGYYAKAALPREFAASVKKLTEHLQRTLTEPLGGEVAPLLWELLKIAVAYEKAVSELLPTPEDEAPEGFLDVSYDLSSFLGLDAFAPQLPRRNRVTFFARIIDKYKMKRSLQDKKNAFLRTLRGAVEILRAADSGKEDTAVSNASLVLDSAMERFSSKTKIDDSVRSRAIRASEYVKRELCERGIELDSLGLSAIGDGDAKCTVPSCTYPR